MVKYCAVWIETGQLFASNYVNRWRISVVTRLMVKPHSLTLTEILAAR